MNQTFTTSIKYFPHLPNLHILDINNNSLTDHDVISITKLFPSLTHFDISFNKVESINSFKYFKNFYLKVLVIKGNPCFNQLRNTELIYQNIEKKFKSIEQIDDYICERAKRSKKEESEDDIDNEEYIPSDNIIINKKKKKDMKTKETTTTINMSNTIQVIEID
jgi:hypothetical protein